MRYFSSLVPQQSFFPSKLRALTPKKLGLMCSTSSPSSASSSTVRLAAVHPVPGLTTDEISAAASEAFARHCSSGAKRAGSGVAIVWFRNDLRVVDNEALLQGWAASNALLPVYCVDPRHFGSTHLFGFPKTGGINSPKGLFGYKYDLIKVGFGRSNINSVPKKLDKLLLLMQVALSTEQS